MFPFSVEFGLSSQFSSFVWRIIPTDVLPMATTGFINSWNIPSPSWCPSHAYSFRVEPQLTNISNYPFVIFFFARLHALSILDMKHDAIALILFVSTHHLFMNRLLQDAEGAEKSWPHDNQRAGHFLINAQHDLRRRLLPDDNCSFLAASYEY